MATSKWILDPAHSEIQFKVRHMMISHVTGNFSAFEATAETEGEDFTTAKASFTANTNSVTTGNEQRDEHLKGPEFLDSAKFPQIRFTPTKYENVGDDGSYEVYGDLTVRDVTKQVKL